MRLNESNDDKSTFSILYETCVCVYVCVCVCVHAFVCVIEKGDG